MLGACKPGSRARMDSRTGQTTPTKQPADTVLILFPLHILRIFEGGGPIRKHPVAWCMTHLVYIAQEDTDMWAL